MESQSHSQSANSIDKKVAQIRDSVVEKIPANRVNDDTRLFVSQYYADVPPEDLLNRDPDSLTKIALGHFDFGRKRKPGSPLVKVYFPELPDQTLDTQRIILEIVTDDMPFLVDSVGMEINRQDLIILLTIHPLIQVQRNEEGELQRVVAESGPDQVAESFLRVEIENETMIEDLTEFESNIHRILRDVARTVEDWPRIIDRVKSVDTSIDTAKGAVSDEEIRATHAFIRWMVDQHFIFMGYREYNLLQKDGQDILQIEPGSGLGILREDSAQTQQKGYSVLPPYVAASAREKTLLILTKANAIATVHRSTHIDYVGVKRFNKNGEVTGEHRFLGLYTSKVFLDDPYEIPVVRGKLQAVIQRSGLQVGSHSEKALQTILRNYHRSELFQISTDLLYEISMGILHSQERQQTRLFVRKDVFGRFVSCLVFVPRDRYTTELRMRLQGILMEAFNGTSSDFTIQLSASILARINFWIRTDPEHIREVDEDALESALVEASRTWHERLFDALGQEVDSIDQTKTLLKTYGNAFPISYIEYYKTPKETARDIIRMESIDADRDANIAMYRLVDDDPTIIRIKFFHLAEPIPLSNILPILENLNLRVTTERPFDIRPKDEEVIWLDAFKTVHVDGKHFDIAQIEQEFQNALLHIWRGHAENDGFNRLVLDAGLTWRQVSVLRACGRYLIPTAGAVQPALHGGRTGQ